MAGEFEIIRRSIRRGTIADCLQLPNTRCLSSSLPDIWLIEGAETLSAYLKLTKNIHSDKRINNGYTIQQVQKILDVVILENKENTSITEESLIKQAKNKLPTSNEQGFDFMRNIYGITVKRHRQLGPFIFQKRNNALGKYYLGKRWVKHKKFVADYVLRYKVTSVSRERALEMADRIFASLEYLFAFLLGRKDSGYEIRIIRPTKENKLFYLCKSDNEEWSMGHARTNMVFRNLDLDDKYFRKDKVRLFFSIIASPKGPIENRLNKAINWIGKGLFADSSIDSIIFFSSALEAMLIRDPKAIISPSIVSSLAEYCAFLLGKNKRSRQEIASIVKDIYSERSAGTHGGKLMSDSIIEQKAAMISRMMVFRLLSLYPNKVKTEDDIIQFVDNLKYS